MSEFPIHDRGVQGDLTPSVALEGESGSAGSGSPSSSAARDRRFVRDVVRGELRKGNIRLALAILLWPPGWSHTRLEDE